MREDDLERAVVDRLRPVVLTEPDLRYVAQRVAFLGSESRRVEEMEQRALALQKSRLEARLTKLLYAYLDDVVARPDFESQTARLKDQCARIEQQLERYESAPGMIPEIECLLRDPRQLYDRATENERRQLIELATEGRFVARRAVFVEPRRVLAGC